MTTTNARSPFKRPGFIVAAVIVGIILIAGLIVLVTSPLRDNIDFADPRPSPSASSSASPSISTAEASICGLEGVDDENTLTAAPETDWDLVGTVAAPSGSDGAGPGDLDEAGFRSCYAHTAEGALFAAVNIYAMSTDSRLAGELSERYLAPGPGRDAAIERGRDIDPTNSTRAQLAGYKIDSYSIDETTVDLVFQISSSGQLVSIPTVLQWNAGDWKIVTDAEGLSPLAPAPIENLAGYTPWSGA